MSQREDEEKVIAEAIPKITIEQMVAAVGRELRFRAKVYPRLVKQHQMSETHRLYEMACMRAVEENLKAQLPPPAQASLLPEAANG